MIDCTLKSIISFSFLLLAILLIHWPIESVLFSIQLISQLKIDMITNRSMIVNNNPLDSLSMYLMDMEDGKWLNTARRIYLKSSNPSLKA